MDEENLKIPHVSVIMPIYNGGKYLKEALDSILNQTYKDFELILLNDCSTDDSETIIFSYEDSRIVYIKNNVNLGLIKTLNKGLDVAKGKFIARMDQDDIAISSRFEKQISIFKQYPEIGVCGTWFTCFSEEMSQRTLQHPENDEDIKISLLGRSSLGHPTVMMRKSAIADAKYDEDYNSAEDYEFWTRLSRITKLHNIPEALLLYRLHNTNMSVLEETRQSKNAKKIIGNQLKFIGLEDHDLNIKSCEILFGGFYTHRFTNSELISFIIFANQLETANESKKFYDKKVLNKTITLRLNKIFDKTQKRKLSLLPFLLKNRKEILLQRGIGANIRIIAKMILRK